MNFTQTEIDSAVKTLIRQGKAHSRSVETVLVMAVYDSIVNSSANTANALIGALRKSMKRDGVIAFLEKYGKLYFRSGKTGFVHFALGSAGSIVWDADYSAQVKDEAMLWEDYKPAAPEIKAFDVIKALEAIVKKAEDTEADVVNRELATYLTPLIAQYTSKMALNKLGVMVPAPAPVPAPTPETETETA